MTHQTLQHFVKEVQEELIQSGFVELIIPYFFINVKPEMDDAATMQKLDQFSYLISLDAQLFQTVSLNSLKPLIMQQMLYTCQEVSQENSARTFALIKLNIKKEKYDKSDFGNQNDVINPYDENEFYHIAQACCECGYKGTLPATGRVFHRIEKCPMCEQETFIQAV